MLTLRTAVVLSVSTLAILTQACTLASPTEVTMKPIEQDSDATEAKGGSNGTTRSTTAPGAGGEGGGTNQCKAALAKVDVSKLTACGDGAGHCYAKSKVPGALAFKPCDTAGEVCVPDTVLKSGGGKLKSCKVAVLNGVAGACLPVGTMPEGSDKEQAKSNLKQDACDAGELCGPCQNPLANNAATGLCEPVGVADGDCGGGATTPAAGGTTTAPATPAAECCGGKGQCMPKASMPNGSGDNMEKDSCVEANVCAPKALVAGKATKCTTMLMKGICVGGCFNSMLDKVADLGLLRQGDCAEEESCVPCAAVKKFMAGDGVAVPGCE